MMSSVEPHDPIRHLAKSYPEMVYPSVRSLWEVWRESGDVEPVRSKIGTYWHL